MVIGLMSGTSLDGLDMAACRFSTHETRWSFEIVAAENMPYEAQLQQRLLESVNLSGLELSLLDLSLGRFFGEEVKLFCKKYALRPDFISSHGHTVFHQPGRGLTLQIGNPESISHFSGLPVVANFRLEDVLKGGQGAPLVPVGEKFLFPQYRIFLNLGGIANIAVHHEENIQGFDVTICNMALNYLASKKGMAYDKNGDLARSGKVDTTLLEKLNSLPFFKVTGPKSLGYEWFSEEVKPLLDAAATPVENILRTVVLHVAEKICGAIKAQPEFGNNARVMTTGGGALNSFLMEKLNELGAGKVVFDVPGKQIVEYKEALVFAFLGLRRVLGLSNVSRLVTGAGTDSSAGSLHGAFRAIFY